MNVDGDLSLNEAKRYACLRQDMPAWALLPTVEALYVELRKLEATSYNENCSCHPNLSNLQSLNGKASG